MFKILYAFLCALINLFAQPDNILFERVATEKGFSSGTIQCILKDRLGFIWLGTNNGLMRYDGYDFKEYKYNPLDSNAISGNQVWHIIQDKNDNLWIGTSGRGLNKYLYNEDRFVHYRHHPDDSTSLASDQEVVWLAEDSDGFIWVALWEGGLDMLDPTTNKFTHYKNKSDDQSSLISNSVNRVFCDKDGFVWAGTSRGISKLDKKSGRFISYRNIPGDKTSLAGNYINSMIEDMRGVLWIGSNGGLSKYDEINDRFINYSSIPAKDGFIKNSPVFSLCSDIDGNLWVGTDGGGLNIFNTNTGNFTNYSATLSSNEYLTSNSVPSLFLEDQSILWIGTVAEGLFKAVIKKSRFFSLRQISDYNNSFSLKDVSAIYESRNGLLWIGTYGGGLNKYDLKTKKVTSYVHTNTSNSISSNFVLSITEDSKNNLWIGTEDGLNYFNPAKNEFKKYFSFENDTSTLSSNKITCLLIDSKENLWIGTNGGGLNILSPNYNTFTRVNTSERFKGFTARHVWSLFEDSKGNVWIGTWGLGAIKYNYDENSFKVHFKPKVEQDSVILKVVVSFAEDSDSNIWFGTWGDGLVKFDPATNRLTPYGIAKGIPHENIYGILPSDDGSLWISSGNGLVRFDPYSNHWQAFDEDDGLQSLEFRRGAVHKGKSGTYYFGGIRGLNYFRPEIIKSNTNLPSVAFTSFKIFEREVSPQRIGGSINNLSEIVLPYNENFLSFEFSALEYTSPLKNHYAYMMEGVDNNWVYSQSRRYAGYPALSPGEYTLYIKAANNDGVWNERAKSIKIIITPPFYRTWIAYIFYTFITVGALFAIRRYELKKRKRKHENQIREEMEKATLIEAQLRAEKAELQTIAVETEKEIEKQKIRYRIAADLHDEIGSNLSSISILSSLMGSAGYSNEELTEQLLNIRLAASSSTDSIRDIVWFLNPTSDVLSILISRMKETANMMLKGINFKFDSEEYAENQKINPDIKRNVYLIFKETLNNIIKHSNAGSVTINLKSDGRKLNLSISDNGRGFVVDEIQTGNGLRNLRNRADEIGGLIIIDSSPGKGTTIQLNVDIT